MLLIVLIHVEQRNQTRKAKQSKQYQQKGHASGARLSGCDVFLTFTVTSAIALSGCCVSPVAPIER